MSPKTEKRIKKNTTAVKKTPSTKQLTPETVVGRKLHELRVQQGWTLKVLAEHSRLNINTLSMIEKGKTSPSVGTLQQLARALDVPINAFFESNKISKKIIFTSHDHRPKTTCCNATIHNLGKDLKTNKIEPFVIVMNKDAGSGGRTIVHTGLEFAYCISGRVQYLIEEVAYRMEPGDSLVFEAHLPHRWENACDGESQMILVITPSDQHDEPGGRHFNQS